MAPWKHGLSHPSKKRSGRDEFFYALAEEANQCDEENYSKFLFRSYVRLA
jgi:hypothetical protein